jgi:hypothetical protein
VEASQVPLLPSHPCHDMGKLLFYQSNPQPPNSVLIHRYQTIRDGLYRQRSYIRSYQNLISFQVLLLRHALRLRIPFLPPQSLVVNMLINMSPPICDTFSLQSPVATMVQHSRFCISHYILLLIDPRVLRSRIGSYCSGCVSSFRYTISFCLNRACVNVTL